MNSLFLLSIILLISGCGNSHFKDSDWDGCPDKFDAFPHDMRYVADSDGDGLADRIDNDDDNDGAFDIDDLPEHEAAEMESLFLANPSWGLSVDTNGTARTALCQPMH